MASVFTSSLLSGAVRSTSTGHTMISMSARSISSCSSRTRRAAWLVLRTCRGTRQTSRCHNRKHHDTGDVSPIQPAVVFNNSNNLNRLQDYLTFNMSQWSITVHIHLYNSAMENNLLVISKCFPIIRSQSSYLVIRISQVSHYNWQ